MKVFKFGGASVKDADSVRNVASVLKRYPNENLIIVISAMGKTTNALEKLADVFFYGKDHTPVLEEIKEYHRDIIVNLFSRPSHPIFKEVREIFLTFEKSKSSGSYNKDYDQIVSLGEIISTKIVSAYLN